MSACRHANGETSREHEDTETSEVLTCQHANMPTCQHAYLSMPSTYKIYFFGIVICNVILPKSKMVDLVGIVQSFPNLAEAHTHIDILLVIYIT